MIGVLEQGDLDGACGFYAITNAIRTLFPQIDPRGPFGAITRDLYERGRLFALLLGAGRGTLNDALSAAHSWCMKEEIEFDISRPFWVGRAQSLAGFRRSLRLHFETLGSPTCAIIAYHYADGEPENDHWHWTVVSAVTDKLMRTKDSDRQHKQIRFSRCRIWTEDGPEIHHGRPYQIDTASTFLLSRR